jgi:hypothetical protein
MDVDKEKELETLREEAGKLHNFMIRSAFDHSRFLREKTMLPPDLAYAHFGENFKTKIIHGNLKIVGSYDGVEILSNQTGELADFEEAIEYLVEKHLSKNAIMKVDCKDSNKFTKKIKPEIAGICEAELLPCIGKDFDIGKNNEMLIWLLSDPCQRTEFKIKYMEQEATSIFKSISKMFTLNTFASKNYGEMENLINRLFDYCEKMYLLYRLFEEQKIANRYEHPTTGEQMYPSMVKEPKKFYKTNLCSLCLKNRKNKCTYINNN